jgi:serine protease Do
MFVSKPEVSRSMRVIALVGLALSFGVDAAAQPASPPAEAKAAAPEKKPSATAEQPLGAPSEQKPATPAAPAAAIPRTPGPRDGVVSLERAGRRLGFGAVLRSDGRILSALSPLGHGNFIRARFADDSVLSVRVVQSDRRWDLALLAPEGGHWTEGVRPSSVEVAAEGAKLRRFRGREALQVTTAGRKALLGRDGAVLEDVLVLREPMTAEDLGSPLFDEAGQVVALAVQACAPESPRECKLGTHGAPVSALKAFLKLAPARAPRPSALFGVVGVAGHDGSSAGVRILSIEPDSPAAKAGLRAGAARVNDTAAGDLIVAVDDGPVATPEELREAIDRIALASPAVTGAAAAASPGTPERVVRLLLLREGRFREVTVSLQSPLARPSTTK